MLEATSDICSTKSAYKMPAIEEAARNPPSNIPMQVLQILRHVWADKTIQPRVKTFVWRFLRLALGIARGIRRIIWTIDENCSRCGRPEDDKHLFFDCSFARAVWFASPIGLRADALPQAGHGLHFQIAAILQQGPSQATTGIIFSIVALFVSLIIRTFQLVFSARTVFSLTTNQPEQCFDLFFQ